MRKSYDQYCKFYSKYIFPSVMICLYTVVCTFYGLQFISPTYHYFLTSSLLRKLISFILGLVFMYCVMTCFWVLVRAFTDIQPERKPSRYQMRMMYKETRSYYQEIFALYTLALIILSVFTFNPTTRTYAFDFVI